MSRGKRLYAVRSGSTASAEATWAADGKSVRWHSGHATAQMNVENVSYTVVYLYQAKKIPPLLGAGESLSQLR